MELYQNTYNSILNIFPLRTKTWYETHLKQQLSNYQHKNSFKIELQKEFDYFLRSLYSISDVSNIILDSLKNILKFDYTWSTNLSIKVIKTDKLLSSDNFHYFLSSQYNLYLKLKLNKIHDVSKFKNHPYRNKIEWKEKLLKNITEDELIIYESYYAVQYYINKLNEILDCKEKYNMLLYNIENILKNNYLDIVQI